MKKWAKNFVILSLLIISISAIYSGFEMIIQPDGSSLGLSISYLDNRYFTDFRILPSFFL